MASIKNMTKVRVDNIFLNLVAIKNLNLINCKAVGKNFKETFESNVETSLNGITLFDKNSIVCGTDNLVPLTIVVERSRNFSRRSFLIAIDVYLLSI